MTPHEGSASIVEESGGGPSTPAGTLAAMTPRHALVLRHLDQAPDVVASHSPEVQPQGLGDSAVQQTTSCEARRLLGEVTQLA